MKRLIVRAVPAAVALSLATLGAAAFAQTTAPSTTEKVEDAGKSAWDSTKHTSKKAWDATKHGTHKAVKATEHAADATGNAIDKGADAAAGATRDVGNKIGSKLPPDPNKP
jgi:hypothetical protein